MIILYLQEYVGSPTLKTRPQRWEGLFACSSFGNPNAGSSPQRYHSIGPNKTCCASMSSFCGKGLGPLQQILGTQWAKCWYTSLVRSVACSHFYNNNDNKRLVLNNVSILLIWINLLFFFRYKNNDESYNFVDNTHQCMSSFQKG